jgi:hypothetical protein
VSEEAGTSGMEWNGVVGDVFVVDVGWCWR